MMDKIKAKRLSRGQRIHVRRLKQAARKIGAVFKGFRSETM
jgi:hypothetical protein